MALVPAPYPRTAHDAGRTLSVNTHEAVILSRGVARPSPPDITTKEFLPIAHADGSVQRPGGAQSPDQLDARGRPEIAAQSLTSSQSQIMPMLNSASGAGKLS